MPRTLSRSLIQFASPGTPDLYQGDEIWNFALVDPDNRRPVDYAQRAALLDDVCNGAEAPDDMRREFVAKLVNAPEDGRIKMHVIRAALAGRREHPALFSDSEYLPLQSAGQRQDHLFAFARRRGMRSDGSRTIEGAGESPTATDRMVVVVPRLTTRLVDNPAAPPIGRRSWGDTMIRLPEAWRNCRWRNAMTGERGCTSPDAALNAADALQSFPVALLFAERE